MTKLIAVSIVLVTLFSNNAFAGNCTMDLRFLLSSTKKLQVKDRSLNGEQLKDEIERLERVIEFFRLKKENVEPAISIHFKRSIAELDAHLMTDNFSVANRMLRTLFRKVEYAFSYVRKVEALIAKIEAASDQILKLPASESMIRLDFSDAEKSLVKEVTSNLQTGENMLAQLKSGVQEQKIILARNFHGYFQFRHHLEEIAGDNTPKTTHLLTTLGSQSDKEQKRFPYLFDGSARPSLEEFKQLIYSDHHMDLVRLRVERNFEIFQAIKNLLLQPEIVTALFNQTINIPGMHKTRVVRLFKFIYDRQARELYFPKINKVIRTEGLEPKERLGLLRELNSTTVSNELLIAFARRVDTRASDTWDTLKKAADDIDKDFADKMKSAKEKAKSRGEMSAVYKRSHVGKLAVLLVTGGAASYLYFGEGESTAVVTELPVEETELHTEGDNRDSDSTGELPEANEPVNGVNQESFLPAPTQNKEDITYFSEDNHPIINVNDTELEASLQLLENFALGQ